MDKPLNYTIVKESKNGVLIQLDNGDSQYLTNAEYTTFKKNRKKQGFM